MGMTLKMYCLKYLCIFSKYFFACYCMNIDIAECGVVTVQTHRHLDSQIFTSTQIEDFVCIRGL